MKNHKDERIYKLIDKGLTVEQVAIKIGYGNLSNRPAGIARVNEALARRYVGQ